ncbi:flagellar hook-associated protein FlgK [Planctomycetota bacterium]|nr:flagellar hook-associated protein FlgK [Planctomycetota bacterium]
MTLNSALQIGRSGLLTAQTAMEVTGNNLANAATPGYHRNTVALSAVQGQRLSPSAYLGAGVQLDAIKRQTDEALEARIRSSVSDGSHAQTQADLLRQVESIQAEYSSVNLTSSMGKFFDSWSALANNPQDYGKRTSVISESESLSKHIQQMDSELKNLREQTDSAIKQSVITVNDLLKQVELSNKQIALSEQGTGNASALRDQRDQLLGELSKYMEISTVEMPSGSVDVYVGSTPIVMNGEAEHIEMTYEQQDGVSTPVLKVGDDKDILQIQGGQLGALIEYRTVDINEQIATLDQLTHEMIFEVNKIHSQSQGLEGFSTITGTYNVDDTSAALNSPEANMDFVPEHGSFKIHVKDKTTGQMTSTTINIDLDGIGGNDTSLDSLAVELNAINGINASITADGKLQLDTNGSNLEMSFSDDTSGALAALGINTFFSGHGSSNIELNEVIAKNPDFIAAGQGHTPGDNSTALALDALRDQSLDGLNGASIMEFWTDHVQDLAVKISQASSSADASQTVLNSLQAQQQSLSGVNVDEETINLMQYQQAYNASARFISTIQDLMETLLQIA